MSKHKAKKRDNRLRINNGIRASELRVLIDGGESKVMKTRDAIKLSEEMGLDLIEISASAKPPVARITDYGKFQYDQKKKQKEIKAKQHTVEVKSIQIRMGTGGADLELKAKKASEWLADGQRVKAELYLRGRAKYMDKKFLHDRLGNVLSLITEDYKVVDDYKKSPKGIAILIEPDKTKKKKESLKPKTEKSETDKV
ncbi:MAG: translation initiation factor IF-3 [Candidatus Pacebacteria bacterium]|nr:translation initiation factor IF-3 [Candidatus Paceibacterota bacterium]